MRSKKLSQESQILSKRRAVLESGGGRAAPRRLIGLNSAPFNRLWLKKGPTLWGPLMLVNLGVLKPSQVSWSVNEPEGEKSAASALGCWKPLMGQVWRIQPYVWT